jgi:hypothetical protein
MAIPSLSRIRDLYSDIYSETPEALQMIPLKAFPAQDNAPKLKNSDEEQKLAEMQQRDRTVRSRVEGVLASLGVTVKGNPVYELISGSDSRFYIKDGKITVQVDGITVSASPEAIMGKIKDIRRIFKKGDAVEISANQEDREAIPVETKADKPQPKAFIREYERALQPLLNYGSQGGKTTPPATPLLFDQMF